MLARLALGAALGLLGAWLVGPWRPWALPGSPTLIPGEGQKHVHTVLVALWWAAAANACGIALLLATAGRWAREAGPPRPAATHRIGRATWLLLLGAAALAGVLRWPLAHGGLWLDETWNVRHTIVGKRDPAAAAPERFDFHPVTWRETLWHYSAPTNHPAYSVAARLTTGAWRLLSGEPRHAFDEFALRLPAFAAALGAVVLVGVLVAELGFPRAAPVAAFLLAIHPWHVRIGADGRGYAFVVLFALAGAWLLLRALRSGRWRWWLGYGLSQLLLLWSFPLAVHVPLALAVAGSVAIVLGAAPPGERGLQLARLVVANALAAMLFLQLMAPNLAQALAFKKEWRVEGDLGLHWYRVLWVALATGLKAGGGGRPDVAYPSLAALARGQPWLPAVVYGTTVGLAGLGLARALRRGAAAERAVWAALALGVPLFLLHRSLQPFFVMWRFLMLRARRGGAPLGRGTRGRGGGRLAREPARRDGLPRPRNRRLRRLGRPRAARAPHAPDLALPRAGGIPRAGGPQHPRRCARRGPRPGRQPSPRLRSGHRRGEEARGAGGTLRALPRRGQPPVRLLRLRA